MLHHTHSKNNQRVCMAPRRTSQHFHVAVPAVWDACATRGFSVTYKHTNIQIASSTHVNNLTKPLYKEPFTCASKKVACKFLTKGRPPSGKSNQNKPPKECHVAASQFCRLAQRDYLLTVLTLPDRSRTWHGSVRHPGTWHPLKVGLRSQGSSRVIIANRR